MTQLRIALVVVVLEQQRKKHDAVELS